jgi:hypothetical protein
MRRSPTVSWKPSQVRTRYDLTKSRFTEDLLSRLASTSLTLRDERPRLLITAAEAGRVRDRALADQRVVDVFVERANAAAKIASNFGPRVENAEIFSHAAGVLGPLSDAALILEDERFAARALDAIEAYYRIPTSEWPPPARRSWRCHLSIPMSAALIGVVMDYCGDLWSAGAKEFVSERISGDLLPRFLETWRRQDEFWTGPSYHLNWKIVCCGDSGLGALACGESVEDIRSVLDAALDGVLDVLDAIPPEGDWPEGASYYLIALASGLRFGLALKNATGGAIDLMAHPVLEQAGDFLMHMTEPDGEFYDLSDNPGLWPRGNSRDHLNYLSLLAKENRRGDWARTARMGDKVTLERLMWDDPTLESVSPPITDTARQFHSTGLAFMRSGWDDKATYVGFKSGNAQVGHAHLDVNSFVITAKGERLLVDEGTWPYAALQGYFDYTGPRFDFDNTGTIGHNSLLVDGGGQHPASRDFGKEYSGKLVAWSPGPQVDIVVGDATAAYAGKLDRYVRTLAYVKPDLLLIYDQVASSEPRYLEFLFHHDGAISGDENVTTITRGNATVTLMRVLPTEVDCWRTSDVARTSAYTNSDTLEPVRAAIRYRSFGPFHPGRYLDVLWAVFVGEPDDFPAIDAVEEKTILNVRVTLAGGGRRDITIDRVS